LIRNLADTAGIDSRLALRYAAAGLTATAINFLSRLALSQALPFEFAILVAQGFGFTAGFLLYRGWVFRDAATRLPRQVAAFAGVNVFSTLIVLAVAVSLRAFLLAFEFPLQFSEAMAHAGGLASGAGFNFLGHRLLTFARKRDA
jgi:energy-coupling factor transport system substrate-specific component